MNLHRSAALLVGGARAHRLLLALAWLGSSVALTGCGVAPFGGYAEQDRTTLDDTVDPADPLDTDPNPAEADEPLSDELTFAASTAFCCNPLRIDFAVDQTTLKARRAGSFTWDFGDGSSDEGLDVTHTYIRPGEYSVGLSAQSWDGGTLAARKRISVGSALVGESVILDGASDPQDPATPDDQDSLPPTDDPGTADQDPLDDPTDDPPANEEWLFAHAGSDQVVSAGDEAILDGTATQFSGTGSLSVIWRQVAGPSVLLIGGDTLRPTFVAPPDVQATTTLTFELLVSSGSTNSTDRVSVIVRPATIDEEPPAYGADVEFLSGPSGPTLPGLHEVSWRFLVTGTVANVFLRLDCCRCGDTDSALLTPDSLGVYRTFVDIAADRPMWYYVRYTSGVTTHSSRSIYVNPPAGTPSAEPPAVIWFHHWGRDLQTLDDVLSAGVVTHVLIAGADRVGVPHTRPEILLAMSRCRAAGVKVIWSRNLWNVFEDLQTLADTFDPAFYVAAMVQTNEEAAQLGADFSALDCETYSGAPLDAYLDTNLPEENLAVMRLAISAAAQLVQVDFVYPSGAAFNPQRANNLYALMGRTRIAESTYYDMPHKICRIDYPYEVFGAFVRSTTQRTPAGDAPFFLPHDIVLRRYHWSQADGAPDGVNGLMLYPGIDPDDVARTARMLADFFAGS